MASDDSQLLAALGRGDRQALERIYGEHKDALLMATVYLLRGDRPAAEDVLHDVIVTLTENAAGITLRGSLRNYLLSACLNRARNLLRRRDRPVESQQLHDLAGCSPEIDIEETTDIDRFFAQALARLADEQREVVTLHIHGGQTFREIAEMLSISINTAQSRYRYALEHLRKQLANQAAPRKE